MRGRTFGLLAGMWALWGGLLLWSALAKRLSCTASAPFLVLLMTTVTLSGLEAALYRRHAFLARYLIPEGALFRLLRGRALMVLWQAVKGAPLALILLISSLRFAEQEWLVLFLDALVLVALSRFLAHLLRSEVRTEYRWPMARRWALRLNATLLWLVLVCVLFFSSHEDYRGLAWQEVVVYSASQVEVQCDVLGVLARLSHVAESLPLWAAQNLLGDLQRPAETLTAWVMFLAAFGVSFVVAWSYSRALGGVASRPWKLLPPARGERP